jgi:hypothetical protein
VHVTDDDLLAALDLDVPSIRPEFRSRMIALADRVGPIAPDLAAASDTTVVVLAGARKDARTPEQRRRRWLVPAVAAAAVVAILGTWVVVTAPADSDPAAPPSTPAPTTPVPTTVASPAVTALAGCAPLPAPTLSADDVPPTPMPASSLSVTWPVECRQRIPADGGELEPIPVTLSTRSGALTLEGVGGATRGSYDVGSIDPATSAFVDFASGDLIEPSTTPFGFDTTVAPPSTVDPSATFSIPLPSEPCVIVGVSWSNSDVSGLFTALVQTTDVACPPFG